MISTTIMISTSVKPFFLFRFMVLSGSPFLSVRSGEGEHEGDSMPGPGVV